MWRKSWAMKEIGDAQPMMPEAGTLGNHAPHRRRAPGAELR
jgi:hypothetical protein